MVDALLTVQSHTSAEVIENNERTFIIQVRVGDHFTRNFVFCQQHLVDCASENEETARRWAQQPERWCYHCGKKD